MYNDFFGFRERPFRLVPDPAYLFLSKSHEEAMAHLTYAISQGEGFVEIIGEAGTGKTTLCRAFLERLDKDIEAAYIFNPKLDSVQLLKAVNDEFEIDSKDNHIKALIDILNAFLMKKKAEGKKAILLIDEAQNLTQEVLEQLRLLSNLETTTAKLLQIILVGQPELGDMLDSYALRQLGQRITLSCCLKPLTYTETRAYIRHRIDIASQRPGVKFSRAAFASVYRYSGGIPRLVNIACDRALLTAFSLNRPEIGAREARTAIKELAGKSDIRPYGSRRESGPVILFSLLLAAVFIFILYHFQQTGLTAGGIEKSPALRAKAPVIPVQAGKENLFPGQHTPTSDSVPRPPESLAAFLRHREVDLSRKGVFLAVLKLWGTEAIIRRPLENMKDDTDFFRIAAIQNGFSTQPIQNDLELVKNLNLPAILKCYLPGSPVPRYVVLSSLDGRSVTLQSGTEKASLKARINDLKSYWTGSGAILWKNSLGLVPAPPLRLSKDSVITLKMVLKDIGFSDIQINPLYDRQTEEAVKQIQARHGLKVDGIVGPLTKIVLNSEIKSSGIPHIRRR